jgi:hypothetical protein
MEYKDVKLGMKVIPTQKSYARDLYNSEHWKMAISKGQNFLFVNYAHPSNTHGKVFVLGAESDSPNSFNGDFFLSQDFEPLQETL